MKLKQLFWLVLLVLGVCRHSHSQAPDLDYYRQITAKSAGAVPPAEMHRLEQAALASPETVDNYYALAKAFAKTSERVWAVVYTEAYCSHASDPKRFLELSSLLGNTFASSLSYQGTRDEGTATVSFMEVMVIGDGSPKVPFEANFELAIATGFTAHERFNNISIKTLHEIREGQLRIWKAKSLPEHGLMNWRREVSDAGFGEAYDYWLFQRFRPAEYEKWRSQNAAKLTEFLAWRQTHKFDLSKKNFIRLHAI